MSNYKCGDLTEEIFGHLCNVALHKCSDKSEKKRAGCGGRAMRKRVLIKNFVSDLFKIPKKPTSSREQDMASSDEEFEEPEMTEMSLIYEDIDGFRLEDLHNYDQLSPMMSNDPWMHSGNSLYNSPEMSAFGNLGADYAYDAMMSSSYSGPSPMRGYQPYDMYGSSMSESATEGDMPLASDPLASLSSMMPSSEPTSFDLYGQSSSSSTSNSSSFFSTDDFFIPNVNEPVFTDSQPQQEDTHELTDLDVATGESHANKNKRRSTELFDDFNVAFQKRIKI